jgi:hypothetical protein
MTIAGAVKKDIISPMLAADVPNGSISESIIGDNSDVPRGAVIFASSNNWNWLSLRMSASFPTSRL